ncbi:MAG TPA: DUF1080 domain-containing protein [Verrucomicrobiales bacterium]|nr:hypothetical protein [Pedosphaera sp.]MBL6844763.1 DUF1080 domain-containing protein [Verrucomicrobiae bacterium]RZO68826.1 MAG: DUF1080 domain-containing protein [Limisphaerales bacterium]HAO67842.1 DUF1080 domain-containing protein [Verrucomicrobiales bacterium]HBP56641.1 DUF1080 domain-containing protein [Verrucomicrobiales bacterium]|tara:strand:+ start:723 stop:1421 length:699 start_codon:yes stop_codon:yes gene_type:complete
MQIYPFSHIRRILHLGLASCVLLSAFLVISDDKNEPVSPDLSATNWKSLFDGKTLKGWKTTNFAGGGDADVKNGSIEIDMGLALSGVQYTNQPPRINYEITLEAMKRDGGDFFCGLTMPYKKEHCTFVCGGWGGGVVGLSSINGMDASENQTTEFKKFENNQWYRISLRVMDNRIQGWIDQKLFLDVDTTDVSVGMRIGEIEESAPLGVATWMTSSSLRDIRLRQVPAPDSK